MALNQTFYISQFTFNEVTYDASTTGGVMALADSHSGEWVESRTGDAQYATDAIVANKGCEVRITMREIKFAVALGTKSDLVATCKTSAEASVTKIYADMVLVSADSGQDRAAPSQVELVFRHVSDDGSTVPIS